MSDTLPDITYLVKVAEVLAELMHHGQRYGKLSYIVHPYSVANLVRGNGYDDEHYIVAMLHDTVEDSHLSFEDLRNLGFSSNVISAIDAMTHRPGEDYHEDYLPRIMQNPMAHTVKWFDLTHNMSTRPNSTKYIKAKEILGGPVERGDDESADD